MILDSDILIYFLNGDEKIVKKVLELKPNQLNTTRINYTELLYGAYNSQKIEKNLEKIEGFLSNFTILEFDKKSSYIFSKQKAKLKQKGLLIADMDLMIASIAIANKKTLVTNNLKHFQRIERLKVLNFL